MTNVVKLRNENVFVLCTFHGDEAVLLIIMHDERKHQRFKGIIHNQ